MITPDAALRNWSRAYAEHSVADWQAYDALCRAGNGVKHCEKLHLLQMACEKLCKAHLLKAGKPGFNRKTHKCIAKTLPLIVRDYCGHQGPGYKKIGASGSPLQLARKLSGRIEALTPSSDEMAPNAEYPWRNTIGDLFTPANHDFQDLADLHAPKRVALIKLLKSAADAILRYHAR